MPALNWVRKELSQNGLRFREHAHKKIAPTSVEVARRDNVSPDNVAKVVVVIADGNPHALVIPASRSLEIAAVKEFLQVTEVRLASEGEIRENFPDCEPGAIPPLRHWHIEFGMDESLKSSQEILFRGGTHQDDIEMNFKDWFNFVAPKVGSFSRLKTRENRELSIDRDEEWF